MPSTDQVSNRYLTMTKGIQSVYQSSWGASVRGSAVHHHPALNAKEGTPLKSFLATMKGIKSLATSKRNVRLSSLIRVGKLPVGLFYIKPRTVPEAKEDNTSTETYIGNPFLRYG